MPNKDPYHLNLHAKIFAATNIADWIYHDVRLDCDGDARVRLVERIQAITEEHGPDALYGVAGSWATKCIMRINKAYARLQAQGDDPAEEISLATNPLGEESDAAELDTADRAHLSAGQFITAIGNDDLEMAEAIFNAAWATSEEDTGALMACVLINCIAYSNHVDALGR